MHNRQSCLKVTLGQLLRVMERGTADPELNARHVRARGPAL